MARGSLTIVTVLTLVSATACVDTKWYVPLQARLDRARAATSGERLLEGTVASTESTGPAHHDPTVAVASWHRKRAGNSHRHTDPTFKAVPFTLQTPQGEFVVDGNLAGVTQRRRLVSGATTDLTARVAPGDHACVLGVVSDRDGQPGLYGDVFIAVGTCDEFHAFVAKETVVSFDKNRW